MCSQLNALLRKNVSKKFEPATFLIVVRYKFEILIVVRYKFEILIVV